MQLCLRGRVLGVVSDASGRSGTDARESDATGPDATESEAQLIERVSRNKVGIELIDSADQLGELVTMMNSATKEACSMLPGGPYPVDYLRSSWADDLELLRRGVRGLCLYQADAVREPGVLKYLSEFVAQGAQVRVAARIAHRTIIIDRQTVVVSTAPDSLGLPFLIVREPAMVRSFYAQFAGQWKTSHSVGVGAEDSLAAETVGEIVGILQSGVTDEVAARQLGVSVRTVRRRVAAVMDLLGAKSRFEAGVKAVRAGWV